MKRREGERRVRIERKRERAGRGIRRGGIREKEEQEERGRGKLSRSGVPREGARELLLYTRCFLIAWTLVYYLTISRGTNLFFSPGAATPSPPAPPLSLPPPSRPSHNRTGYSSVPSDGGGRPLETAAARRETGKGRENCR